MSFVVALEGAASAARQTASGKQHAKHTHQHTPLQNTPPYLPPPQFSVLRYESVIHEFDPYFNYRTTIKLVSEGLREFWNWFDADSWYPLGRVVGGTV